jgi:hypothetical protein
LVEQQRIPSLTLRARQHLRQQPQPRHWWAWPTLHWQRHRAVAEPLSAGKPTNGRRHWPVPHSSLAALNLWHGVGASSQT